MDRREYIWLLLISALYLVISLPYIDSPGLSPDETYFSNVALGRPLAGVFSWHEIDLLGVKVPLMSQGHIGLAKALFYLPFLSMVPPDAAAIRVPSIILGLGAIFLSYFLARRMFGPSAAALTALLFASDPNTIMNFRMDWGPAAVACLSKLLCLHFFVRNMSSPGSINLFFLGFFAGFGLWDKLDFGWILVALMVCALVDKGPSRPISALNKETGKRLLALASGAFIGGLPLWLFNFPVPYSLLLAFWRSDYTTIPFMRKLSVFFSTLDGSAWYQMINGKPPFWPEFTSWPGEPLARTEALQHSLSTIGPTPHTVFPLILLVALAVLYILRKSTVTAWEARCFKVLAVCTATIFGEVLLTRRSYGPQHFFHLYPLLQMITAYAAIRAWRWAQTADSHRRQSIQSIIGIVFLPLAISNILADYRYVSEYRKYGGRSFWSDASYQLADYVKKHPENHFAFLDYGLMHQIIPLTRGRFDGKEYFWKLIDRKTDAAVDTLMQSLLQRKNVIFVKHTPEATQYNQPIEIMNRYFATAHLKTEEVAVFKQKDGLPLIVLFKSVPESR